MQYIDEACWDGYRKDGMKKKGDRMVPNCIKETNNLTSMQIQSYNAMNTSSF